MEGRQKKKESFILQKDLEIKSQNLFAQDFEECVPIKRQYWNETGEINSFFLIILQTFDFIFVIIIRKLDH